MTDSIKTNKEHLTSPQVKLYRTHLPPQSASKKSYPHHSFCAQKPLNYSRETNTKIGSRICHISSIKDYRIDIDDFPSYTLRARKKASLSLDGATNSNAFLKTSLDI